MQRHLAAYQFLMRAAGKVNAQFELLIEKYPDLKSPAPYQTGKIGPFVYIPAPEDIMARVKSSALGRRGGRAILAVAGRSSQLDAFGNESVEFISARLSSYSQIISTIADLAESEEIQFAYLGEVLQYRLKSLMG